MIVLAFILLIFQSTYAFDVSRWKGIWAFPEYRGYGSSCNFIDRIFTIEESEKGQYSLNALTSTEKGCLDLDIADQDLQLHLEISSEGNIATKAGKVTLKFSANADQIELIWAVDRFGSAVYSRVPADSKAKSLLIGDWQTGYSFSCEMKCAPRNSLIHFTDFSLYRVQVSWTWASIANCSICEYEGSVHQGTAVPRGPDWVGWTALPNHQFNNLNITYFGSVSFKNPDEMTVWITPKDEAIRSVPRIFERIKSPFEFLYFGIIPLLIVLGLLTVYLLYRRSQAKILNKSLNENLSVAES